MIDTGKYRGHTRGPWYPHNQDHHGEIMIKVSDDNWKSIGQMRTTADKLLAADAPLLLAEVKRLRKEINQLPIDLHESMDMILEAHYPEVRESVMAMFGDAWGNNLTGYEE
tara:strand:+ start:603 stop:935 length:333 start_codon:yes stop_codon:yes gene_type:complete